MKRMECLDGLRGVLATYVLLGHMAPFAAIPLWIAQPLSHGSAAVDVFFALSGLVIVQSLESFHWQARGYLLARVARTFPVYLVMLGVAIGVQALPTDFSRLPWIASGSPAYGIWSVGWPRHWLAEIAAHLTMLHGLLPDGVLPNAWVSFLGSAWSLSTEWQFYVLALCVGARIGSRRMVEAFLILAVAGFAWQIMATDFWQFSRAFLPYKAHYFALGMASAGLVRGDPLALPRYLGVLVLALAMSGLRGGFDKLLPALVWSICLAAQLRSDLFGLGLLSGVLRSGVLLRLGGWSYCLYLANEPVQKLLGIGLAWLADGNATLFTMLWVPTSLALPLLAATWLHEWIEVPAMRWARSPRLQSVRNRARQEEADAAATHRMLQPHP